jgi:hypothetical protein
VQRLCAVASLPWCRGRSGGSLVPAQSADLCIGEVGIAALGNAAVAKSHELHIEIDAGCFTNFRHPMTEIILLPR